MECGIQESLQAIRVAQPRSPYVLGIVLLLDRHIATEQGVCVWVCVMSPLCYMVLCVCVSPLLLCGVMCVCDVTTRLSGHFCCVIGLYQYILYTK